MPRRDGSLGDPIWVRKDISTCVDQTWAHIAAPGTWFDSHTRLAIAAEVRLANACAYCVAKAAALSPNAALAGEHATFGQLSPSWVEVIHRLTTDHSRLTSGWVKTEVIGTLMSDAQYVEMVSVCALVTALDTFARVLGESLQELPEAVDGEPSEYRPACATSDIAWVATIDPGEAGGPETDIYAEQSGAHIHRALTLVPDEKRAFFALDDVFYLPDRALRRFDRDYRQITHAQIELLAARVSALNQCYYWTTSHAVLLRESSEHTGDSVQFDNIFGAALDSSAIAHASELVAFADAALGEDDLLLDEQRTDLRVLIGHAALVDVTATVAMFNSVVIVADACGIPLEPVKEENSRDIREQLNLDAFRND